MEKIEWIVVDFARKIQTDLLRIHKEGKSLLTWTFILLLLLNILCFFTFPAALIPVAVISLILFAAVLQFFRNPLREIKQADQNLIYAPADGRIVVIEETEEPEYFQDRRIQVSIFMSPTNVHVNRNPISGKVNYYKYHPGKYLVAWHPKSSLENERTTVVIDNGQEEILLRQIAGAMAKRIINYLKVGQQVEQGADMGFIKFGSRVDLFLPLSAKIKVNMNDRVKGNVTVIAEF